MILVETQTETRHQLDALVEKFEKEMGKKTTLTDMLSAVVEVVYKDVFGE